LQTNNDGQYIGLIGGNVTFDGGKIIAPGGRIDVGGLESAGTVTVDNNGLVFGGSGLQQSNVVLTNGAGITARATGTLAPVNTFFSTAVSRGSSINISANNLDVLNSGTQTVAIDAGLDTNSGAQTDAAGDININATGKINLSKSNINNVLRSGAEGSIGDIKIKTGALDVKDQSVISSQTNGKGNAGNIDIKTTGDIIISGIAGISSSTYGQGDAGKITIDTKGNLSLGNGVVIFSAIDSAATGTSQGISINTKNLNLSNSSFITSSNFGGNGNAGNIDIKTTENFNITNSSGISSGTDGKGFAGNINIQTGGDLKFIGTNDQSLLQGDSKSALSEISSSTSGAGNAGKITIDVKGNVSLANRSQITSLIREQASGNSQGISISAGNLSLTEFSRILALNDGGRGNAGNIDIKTTGDLTINGTNNKALLRGNRNATSAEILSLFQDNRTPSSAEIESFLEGYKTISESDIAASTFGQGNSGKVTISVGGNLSLTNRGGIYSNISGKGAGRSQGINITSENLSLANFSNIQSGNYGDKGDAGDIIIKNKGSIDLSNSSFIASDNYNQGNAASIIINSDQMNLNSAGISADSVATDGTTGGNIDITLKDKLILRNNACISTNCQSKLQNANGGNITINSPLIVALPGDSNITANATGGKGGNINITSQGLFGIQYRPKGQASSFTNDITASSSFGRNGNVNIDTPGTDPGKDSNELPNVTTDASNQISQVCSASNRQNKLTVTGRGGLPPNANDPLTSDVIWQDARATSPQPVATNPKTNPVKLVAPAVGLVFDGKGKVTLVAAGTQGQAAGTSVVCPQTK
jgi:large exoprotein involved in heme utilization and adhesion